MMDEPEWLTEAIEAAAKNVNEAAWDLRSILGRLYGEDPHDVRPRNQEEARATARVVLAAALPAIEAGLREQIADEIEDADPGRDREEIDEHGVNYVYGRGDGFTRAARIARGES